MAHSDYVHSPLRSQVLIQVLNPQAKAPAYATAGSSGFDLLMIQDLTINPGQKLVVGTGLAFQIPRGLELQIRPRSGTSLKTDLRLSNSPGTIDSDYRGEVGLIFELPLTAPGPLKLIKGQAYAQGVLAPYVRAEFTPVEALESTQRGAGGYGSTNTTPSPH